MTKEFIVNRRTPGNSVLRQTGLERVLEILLAFDHGVMEFSMGLDNVPRRDRALMRRHNRRLHRALRKRLPRLLERPADGSGTREP